MNRDTFLNLSHRSLSYQDAGPVSRIRPLIGSRTEVCVKFAKGRSCELAQPCHKMTAAFCSKLSLFSRRCNDSIKTETWRVGRRPQSQRVRMTPWNRFTVCQLFKG